MSESQIDHSISRKLKDVAAGFAGGAVQVLIGQPFDLVKVRMQTGQYLSPITAIRDTLKNEGILAFYRGTLAPLFGVGVCVSVQFYGFHEAKRQLLKFNPKQSELTLGQFYLAGAFAGIVNTPITSPVEQIRILLQTQRGNETTLYKGPRDAVSQIYQTYGARGLGRGSLITVLREFQAYGVWFLTYEFLMQNACRTRKIARESISTPELMLYGAIAGDTLWLSSYPLDVIKSRLQSDKFGAESRYGGKISNVVREIVKAEGLRGFWRGIGPALVRAIPCSAATFTTVEFALRLME
ncbi:unnamed protein product [Kuraishia capsulata CBS 1993]|uniref:Uncharacterized protein n=1 Tax=Kuraishia capsulata CBS 1993 TaxID=1382522 RepID=W6MIZ5_9ASCO|nr:uncharacterized protein KUCA_T00002132001 [Kuraishia capsulata CBS 1993]CDK26161.1 unnamed protein product [Kuraishia capsulata CBS 1993]